MRIRSWSRCALAQTLVLISCRFRLECPMKSSHINSRTISPKHDSHIHVKLYYISISRLWRFRKCLPRKTFQHHSNPCFLLNILNDKKGRDIPRTPINSSRIELSDRRLMIKSSRVISTFFLRQLAQFLRSRSPQGPSRSQS